jgi:superoxide dismutase, Fe-Mn family
MITRRDALTTGVLAGAAVATSSLWTSAAGHGPASQASSPAGPFSLPPLPYAADALEPHIDARTMEIHHGRHHASYVSNLNGAIEKTPALKGTSLEDLLRNLDRVPEDVRTVVRNNGGGHHNHSLFWTSLSRSGGAPSGELARAIASSFGSQDTFQQALSTAAMGVFGSGWAWLSRDARGALVVESTPNQDSPLMKGHTPLLGIDVWEHAYYLKYQNRRKEYVDAFFSVIDWSAVADRYAGKA